LKVERENFRSEVHEIASGMTGPAYPAARAVAPSLQAHFADRIAAAREQGVSGLASEPEAAAIETIIDATFWASLRREEGYVPKISLALMPPEQAEHPLKFERQLPLDPAALTRIAPAVERPGIHLGVWPGQSGLRVWGATRTVPRFCFVLEVVSPGMLVVKYWHGADSGKFANVAVLEGDRVKIVNERGVNPADCPNIITSLLGLDSASIELDAVNLLVQLAVSMRAHGRGGSLLVVPAGSKEWRKSIVHPVTYAVSPPFPELAALRRREPNEGEPRGWQAAVRRAVDVIAGLTAVDGATVINRDYELLAFGAKIGRKDGSARVERVMVTEPIVGDEPLLLHPAQLGGTRHLSGAQFVHDQQDAVALVASQDGRFTVFAWSPCEQMVHAHRIEALLL
jgi:hypothetical protein